MLLSFSSECSRGDMRSVYGRKKDGGFGERNLKKVLSRFKSQTCGTNEIDMSRGICKKCHMKATFILQNEGLSYVLPS